MEHAISHERIPTHIFADSEKASKAVALEIAALIRQKSKENKPAVLGLATGSSPKKVYQELIRMHKEEGLSFKNVITFNLDEYHPMEPDSVQSYVRFMKEQLFDQIDIPVTNYHLPDGTLPIEKIPEFCKDYEDKIEKLGGLDFHLLGIGRNGHIGFNEPGSLINSKTRLMTLDINTKIDAAVDFGGLAKVPKKAITLGIDKIMQAKRIVLLAWGEHKAESVARAVEGQVTSDIPASYLQQHTNATFILDETAAALLTRIKTPWLVDSVTWDRKMIKKAVTHLSLHLEKPVLKLTNKDYNENGLADLLNSALVTGGEEVPEGHYAEENMKATVVPNRNKIFSSITQAIALSIAEKTGENCDIAMGIHAGDHAIYPDCRQEFRDADDAAFRIGNWGSEKVGYFTPYLEGDKFTILQDGESLCSELCLDFNEVYSKTNTSYKPIYHSFLYTNDKDEIIECSDWFSDYKSASSVERVEAFIKLGRKDPVGYADETGPVSWEVAKAHVEKVLSEHKITQVNE